MSSKDRFDRAEHQMSEFDQVNASHADKALAKAIALREAHPPTLASIRKLTDSSRYKLARRLHLCPEGYEGPCWGPTDEDYKRADKELARRESHPRDETTRTARESSQTEGDSGPQ